MPHPRSDTDTTSLRFRAGSIELRGWPSTVRAPFGMVAHGGLLIGPARLRATALRALACAGHLCHDEVAVRARVPGKAEGTLTPDTKVSGLLAALRLADGVGILVGIEDGMRSELVATATRTAAARTLLVVPDTATLDRWHSALASHDIASAIEARTIASAARDVHWLGGHHELLVVDAPEVMPVSSLGRLLDGSAATFRIGFAGEIDARAEARLAVALGPVINIARDECRPRCSEWRVALPEPLRARYAESWDRFLCAFERFASTRPGVGFGTFVRESRKDPDQRPALLAWHDAVQLAAWNENKAEVVAGLLARHRGERVLVFTPDRRATYQVAERHLVCAITAQIPRGERRDAMRAFQSGSLRTLVGPRLLDVGVPEFSADVAILVGGGLGRSQRAARCRRVAPGGIIHELVSMDTLEVGRALRWRGPTSEATPVIHAR